MMGQTLNNINKEKRMERQHTYIFDLNSPAELARLINQDRFLTQAMGGPLAGLPALPAQAKVLDVACGPGGWVLDTALERPDLEVAGIDRSEPMISYAIARAQAQGRTNASFGVMDITQPLDFSDATFDLINARLLLGVLKREAWDALLDECTRILKPGGILRLIEPDDSGSTNSPTFEHLSSLGMKALWNGGYGFSLNGRTFGMAPALLRKLKQRGYQTTPSSFIGDYSHDSPGWADFYHNAEITTPQLRFPLIKAGQLTEEEFDQLYQRELTEMWGDDFTALWHFVIICGTAPTR
jgi:SAM-dependent methyltransferase